jgi:hypothetical protein
MQPILDRIAMMIESLKDRIANVQWNDRALRTIGLLLGGVIILLILITVIQGLVGRTGPRPPADNELLLFVPPPEPYLE